MPYITTRKNLKWYYEVKGKGEPILFIHGWAGGLNIWQQQIDFFSKGFLTIALDLPGHGKSSWQESNVKQIAFDIALILDRIRIEKATIIAVSFGGLIAIQFAYAFPDRVKRLILVDTAAKFLSCQHRGCLDEAQIDKLYSLLDKDYVGAILMFARSLFTPEERAMLTFKKGWQLLTHNMGLPNKSALRKFLKIIKEEDLQGVLPQIESEALVVAGQNDYICCPAKAHALQKGLAHAGVCIIEKCGHLPFLTQPELFNKIVKEFIENGKVG